jgi:hypothetical protein
VVQTAQERERDDVTTFRGFRGAWMGAILGQRSMGGVAVKIVQIVGQHTAQVVSVEYDHVVQGFVPDGADEAFHETILPG